MLGHRLGNVLPCVSVTVSVSVSQRNARKCANVAWKELPGQRVTVEKCGPTHGLDLELDGDLPSPQVALSVTDLLETEVM